MKKGMCMFASRLTVGHLPIEVSRITKFLLDRGAKVYLQLSSNHFRRSPLTQGGLEIPCVVFAQMPATTVRSHLLLDKYLELVKDLYADPKNEKIIGSFIVASDERTHATTPSINSSTNARKKAAKSSKPPVKSRDIRTLMSVSNVDGGDRRAQQPKPKKIVLIEIDDNGSD